MIPVWLIISICIFYLIILFGIAYIGDKSNVKNTFTRGPLVYALSLTTYCTVWTFYGSVGKASTSGISFLATYLGPILLCPFWVILFKKIIQICQREKISSISDFIATRYGKNQLMGNIITLMTFLFIIPYISIQLRAISITFDILIDNTHQEGVNTNTAFIIAILMSIFVILFGTRNTSLEQNKGMVSVIAFEAIFKLIAFLIAGIFIIYFVFDGFTDIFSQAKTKGLLESLNNIQDSLEGGYWDWFMLIILSALVFTLLPRQFHLIAIENSNTNNVDKASWIFPLYLFLITIFVIPIAVAGKVYFNGTTLAADSYVLYFPMSTGNNFLATIVFLGGLAAATGMIIVETIAISTMLSKNILIPIVVNYLKIFQSTKVQKVILFTRRISIPIVLFTSYFYMVLIGEDYPLVEVGLISFVGIAQLAPSFFGGLFWKKATGLGTIFGMLAGSIVWFYTLLLPTLIRSGFIGDIEFISEGAFNLFWLKPYALFGLEGLNKISHGFFWSISINIFFYTLISLFTVRSGLEIQQANTFITPKLQFNAVRFRNKYEDVYFHEIYELVIRFLGFNKTKEAIASYQEINQKKYHQNDIVDIDFVDYMENILSDSIGNISARIIISNLLNEAPLNKKEILGILEETKEAVSQSKELLIKSDELKRVQEKLLESNEKLKEIDVLKDEFILTISHELRTPITSIRLLSEMLYNQPEVYDSKKDEFLKTIVQESDRLSNLIEDTLLQEKLDLGALHWDFQNHPVNLIVQNVIETMSPMITKAGMTIQFEPNEKNIFVNADRIHLERVFINIISNAIKFRDENKQENKIKISVADKEVVQIIVEDNGIGIKKSDVDRIFQTFAQVQDVNKGTKPDGSGLGLSISRKIIEKHDGAIYVKSKPMLYTRFFINLPTIQ